MCLNCLYTQIWSCKLILGLVNYSYMLVLSYFKLQEDMETRHSLHWADVEPQPNHSGTYVTRILYSFYNFVFNIRLLHWETYQDRVTVYCELTSNHNSFINNFFVTLWIERQHICSDLKDSWHCEQTDKSICIGCSDRWVEKQSSFTQL